MIKTKTIGLFVCLLLTMQVVSAAQSNAIDGIAATVDEDIILISELAEAKRAALVQLKARTDQLPPDEVINRQVLDRLILTRLQVRKARENGINVTDNEVDKTIRQVAASNKMSMSELRRTLESDGLNFASFWEQIRDEMTIARLQKRFTQQVEVTESEIDNYLSSEQNLSGEFHLGHILIPVKEPSDPAQVKNAAAQAEKIYAELLDGADFAKSALTYSAGQKALEGGDLGWRPASQLPPSMVDALKGLKPGDIARPIPGPSGIHILKLIDKRDEAKHIVTEYKVGHILVKVNELVSAVDALDLITSIKEQLDEGKSFEKLAEKYSDDTATSTKGGDMGWEVPEAFGPQVQQILMSLKEGEVSEPFQSSLGWHIMKLEGVREADRTQVVVRNQAREAIRARKADEELATFVRRLKSDAYIVNKIEERAKSEKSGV
ncbi:MAG: peptidylprolyl isomerase [bacterium]